MSARHTSGPWEACEPGDYGDFDGESRVICGDDQRIAVCHWHPRINTAESDANARLISAAPELLDALYQYRSDLRYPPAPDSVERRLAMIEKLIAKVTGEA